MKERTRIATHQLRRSVGTYAYPVERADGEQLVRGKCSETTSTYMTDPAPCLAQSFPFQQAHTPEKVRNDHRTENRLIHVHLE